jgi:D-serine deaminase-like pyridoxal phosphate-dependent protein
VVLSVGDATATERERPDTARVRLDVDRARLDAATAHLDPPFAVLDLGAFDANAADLARRARGVPIRVASKSLRCRAAIDRALADPATRGIMAFTLPEALWLHSLGYEDLLVAYPTVDRAAIRALATDEAAVRNVTLMVDDPAHLDLIDAEVAATRRAGDVRLCLELDASLRLAGGRVHVGARRSPVHDAAHAQRLAAAIVARPGFVLDGLMAYEAQVAGVGDEPALARWKGPAIRAMQRLSVAELAGRRAEVVAAVRALVPDLRFVNGGGTGSLETTTAEDVVTEVTAGSGYLGPALFDDYRAFQPHPAALFALPVVRRPAPGVATLLGGGYLASGPGGADRLPRPYLPSGLKLTGTEGAGEVQTPVVGAAADGLRIGDRVWLRHVKAGELCERFDALHLVDGDRVVATVPTYRGEGSCFL